MRGSDEVTRRARTQAVGNRPQRRLGVLDGSASGEELTLVCVRRECRGHGVCGKVGLFTVQSSHIPETCAARDRASV